MIGADGAPDWSAIQPDVRCPLCDYNLRGLVEPRCPECGYQFDWRELLDFKLRERSFTFEHGEEHNWRSFFRTIASTWRPGRFWARLKPSQGVRTGRLILYWLIANLVPVFAGVLWAFLNYTSSQGWKWFGPPTTNSGTLVVAGSGYSYYTFGFQPARIGWYKVFEIAHLPFGMRWGPPRLMVEIAGVNLQFEYLSSLYLVVCGLCLLVPWFCFMGLMIFQGTMRRAKIRPAHVLRCVLYASDAPFWFGLALLIALPINILARLGNGLSGIFDGKPFLEFGTLALVLVALPLVYAIVATWRLYVGYRRYLQFRHSAAVIAAVDFILLLGLFSAFLIGHEMLRLW
ncbi:MAG TPA: hypothetical protein VLJ39_21995 [Tepidisphaeraceae bacterium]|nr:hypothetical protein [Tepidisphaeraceae bacterium]